MASSMALLTGWLLASFAVNEALAAGSGSLAGSALLADGQQHLRGAARQSTQSAPDTSDLDDAPPRDAFVKQCSEVLKADSEKTLPVDAMESFCQTTDAVVECRMRLVQGLVEAHKQGQGLEAFCTEAYTWFQTRYGRYCPSQCHKLQCRPACLWLDEKQRLLQRKSEAEAALSGAASLKAELAEAKRATRTARRQVQELNRTTATLKDQVSRAAALRDERHKGLSAATEKEGARRGKRDERQAQSDQLEADFNQAEDELDGLLKAAELRKVEQDGKLEEVKRSEASLERFRAALEKLQNEASEVSERLAAADDDGQERQQQLQAAEREVAAQRTVVEEQQAALQAAEARLQAEGASPEQVKDTLRVSVEEHKSRLQQEGAKLRQLEQRRDLVQVDLSQAQKAAEGARKELAAIQSRQTAEKGKVEEATAGLAKLHTEADALGSALRDGQEEVKRRRESLKQLAKKREKAQKTLGFATQALEEQHEKVKAAKSAVDKANAILDITEADLTRKLAALEEAAQEADEKASEEKRLRQKYKRQTGQAQQRLQEIKKATNDLEMRRPETVRQHDLGLFRLLHG